MPFKLFIVFLIGMLCITSCKQSSERTEAEPAVAVQSHPADTLALVTTTANWLKPPYKQWGIKNVDKLFDTGLIEKSNTPFPLGKDLVSFSDLKIEQFDGQVYSFDQHLDSNRTDGFLILHQGKIITEKYFGNMTEASSHNWFSMSKSLVGLTVDILAEEGLIDLQKPTLHYLPELKGSAWEGTTVQMVMDMLVGIEFNEAYNDPTSDAYKFAKISEFVNVPGPPLVYATMLDYFATVKKGSAHDEMFHYVSLNTEVLGLIIQKITRKQPSEVMSEKVWAPMGSEHNGFIMRNSKGHEMVSGAVNSSLRDAGRFGQLLLDDGYFNGQQIAPKSVVEKIMKGGSVEKFADSKRGKEFKKFNYADQFWHTDNSAFFAKGLFGQWIYIDPVAELVIVKMTTADIPTSTETDWINNMNLMKAIVNKITKI